MTKVEEKLKAGRAKRPEGSGFSEEPQRRPTPSQSSKKDPATTSSGEHLLSVLISHNNVESDPILKSTKAHTI